MPIRELDLDGPVAYFDFGGDGVPVVLVHGAGSSHVEWLDAGRLLAERHRTLAIDLPGAGRSAPAGRSASLESDADVLVRFVESVAGDGAVLMGSSAGGLASMMVAAARPPWLRALALVGPAILVPEGAGQREVDKVMRVYERPGPGAAFLRTANAAMRPPDRVRRFLDFATADPARVSASLLRRLEEMAAHRSAQPWADAAFLQTVRSLRAVRADVDAYLATESAIQAPTLLIAGTEDRMMPMVAYEGVAERRPDWTFERMPGLGHLPMLEAPDRVASLVLDWLSRTLA